MLVLRDRVLNAPLMSLQTGTEVGRTAAAIIDPRRLIIVAFYCEGPQIDQQPAVIHTSDIREFSNIGMIIDSADSIMQPEDLVRLQEVLAFHFSLEGKQVVDSGGQKLGKVVNYTIDPSSFYIMKLHVKPPLLQSLSAAELLIDRSQIQSVDDKRIVVSQPTIRDTRHVPAPIENPFRKARPQAEAIEQK
jgi:sporulation protein YlmC with PRC-barrel domain